MKKLLAMFLLVGMGFGTSQAGLGRKVLPHGSFYDVKTFEKEVWISTGSDSVYHFDGKRWAKIQVPNTFSLSNLWTNQDGTAWVVALSRDFQKNTLLSISGNNITIHAVLSANIRKITGVGKLMYLVGTKGFLATYQTDVKILRKIDIQNFPLPEPPDFEAIWVNAQGHMWLADNHGNLIQGDGESWEIFPFLRCTENVQTASKAVKPIVSAIWGFSQEDVWFVGDGVQHWNGSELACIPLPVHASSSVLFGLWGSNPNDIWIVGFLGTLLHWNGDTLEVKIVPKHRYRREDAQQEKIIPVQQQFQAVWGQHPNDIWLVGSENTIAHYEKNKWKPLLLK